MIVDTANGAVSYDRVGDGPALILLHSLLSDRDVFSRIIPRLAERHTVFAVDLPGFGGTTPTGVGIDRQADVVGSLIETLDLGGSSTAVMGNGLGAFVALGTAIRHGERFGKLVLVGCGAGFSEAAKVPFHAMIDRVETGGMEAVLEVAVRRIFTEDFIDANPEMTEERRTVLRRTNPAVFMDACRSLIELDYTGEVGAIANPTLIVVGSEDSATPPSLGRDLAGRIPGAAFVELPGVAHAPQLQDPSGFLAVVEPFLA
jgi:3-oxoadipate enol-lactonase